MQSRMRVGRHPIHPMLVVFPVALFPVLVVLDVLHGYFRSDPTFWRIGFWAAVGGVVTTVLAMIPGLVDLSAIPDESPAHRTALVHLGVGVVILVLYLGAVAARWPAGSDDARFLPAVVVDVLGLLAITAQGWLGGELVYKHHVGVLTPSEGGDPVTLEARPAQGPSSARGGARRPGAERP